MNESTTSSSDSDAPTTETDQSTEDSPDNEHEGGADTSVMARALKHELEEKGMTVEIEDDGETVTAEKLDQSYRIRSDGSVEGSGVLKDGIEDIVADLDPVEDAEAETEEPSTEPAAEASPDESTSNTDESAESDEREANEAVNNEEEEVAPESTTPNASSNPETTADAVKDDTAVEAEADEEASEETVDKGEGEAEAEAEEEGLPTGTVGQFEASIEVGHLQDVVDVVSAVVEECRIHLTEDGFVIRAVDPANVAMINEQVSADAFETYDTDCGEIGVSLGPLSEILDLSDNDDDLIQFDYDAQTRKIQITVSAVEYTLALIDPDSIRQEPDIPDLDLPASVGVEQSNLSQAVKAADMVSDHIRLRVDEHEQCFIAEAEGDTDDVEFELSGDDLDNTTFGAAGSLFSLDYLKDLQKPIPKDTTVQMDMGEEFPAKFSFEMADGAVDVEYMLAPRIESH